MNLPKDIFKDLKVVEFASVLAGPAVGMFFAELGASVIKVENAQMGGDVTRTWKLPAEDPKQLLSSYYASINWGKDIFDLNLKTIAGREKALELIAGADILISNFKRDSASKFGLAYNQIKKGFPELIYAQLDAFGKYENRLAYDVILQAETGFISMTGKSEGSNAKMPVALIDILAAHQLKEGILVALYKRSLTGKGSFVSTSLFSAAIASLANQASGHLMTGFVPQPMGTLHPNIAPYGDAFTSKDHKPLLLAIGSQSQFEKLCDYLSMQNVGADSRFSNNQNRVANRAALATILQEKIAEFDRKDFTSTCHERGIPCASILNLKEVFSNPAMSDLILEENREGVQTKAVRTVVFEIED